MCQPGYSRTGDFECALCPSNGANGIRLIAIMILIIVLITLMVRSTLGGTLEKRNVTSIYLKIILNHFQLILLTASFNFKWPASVKKFFSSTKPVA